MAQTNQRAVRVLIVDDEQSIRTFAEREVAVEVAQGTDRAEEAILLAPFQEMCGCGAEQSPKFARTLRAYGLCR